MDTDPPRTYELGSWTLEKLLAAPAGAPLEGMLAQLEESVAALEGAREQLQPAISAEEFRAILTLYETGLSAASRLSAYSYLWFSEDTQNEAALAFQGRMEQVLTDAQNRIIFFTLWLKGLDDATAKRLLADLGDRRYFVEQQRLFKDHILQENEEQIINIKNVNGVRALNTIYDMLTNAYKFRLVVDGEEKLYTRGELMQFVRNSDPVLRAQAYQELYRVYGEDGMVLAQIYNHRVRDWHEEQVRLRKFASPIAVRNLTNDVPDAAVATLLEVCSQNAPVFQRWFKLKAGYLGLDKLRRYDIYAPLSAADKTYEFGVAVELVLDCLERFSPTMGGAARRVFDENHIHSKISPGKMGGAFNYGVLPGLTPYVLVNYVGKVDDVATLAHELGHSIHSVLAGGHSVLTFHASLPLAETASVFSEMLVTDRLLADESDPMLRRDVLARAIDDAYATVMRQAYFALWEQTAHAMVKDSASVGELNAAYLENLRAQFGDALEISHEFKWEWVSIPHIYDRPFYVYAYAFGQLLVYALYQQYKQQGESFIPKYLNTLTYGGSASPAHILGEAGVDMTSADFWQGGFDFISGLIDELQAMDIDGSQ